MFKTTCLVALAITASSFSVAHGQPKKVIIDCDPGIDDALELILASMTFSVG